ncbi:MAG TPA: acyltransferase, partial [Aeromicrobium sp.]|nr:acyltransferase [Aeromicrobium sp.]
MLTGAAPLQVAHSRQESDFHPEIQGLRADVVLVVLYHLWPNRLPGGFVGVDVFFVISGYLITSHIHREVAATGTLSLRRFWARRIRRLLPASFVVLAVSFIAALIFLPATLWAQTARQIGASALYVQNWVLVADSVNYMAQDNVPTIAQHYWS